MLTGVALPWAARGEGGAELAPQLPAVLTLKSALQIFDRHGFDLLVAEASVRSAEGDVVIAGAIANPGLSIGAGKSFLCASSQDCSVISYSVGLDDSNAISTLVSGKYRLRKSLAEAALDAARQSRNDARRTLTFTVKQAYYAVLLAEEQREVARETLDSYLETRHLNERRFALGAISETELAKIEVAEQEAEQSLDGAEQGLRQAKVALAFLLGVRHLVPDYQVDRGELKFELPAALVAAKREDLANQALAARPDLRAMIAQERRAGTGLGLAKRSRIPDIGLSVSYSADGSGNSNVSPPSIFVGLSFSLPVFYLQRGEILKAQADLATQQALRNKAEATVISDVENAWTQIETTRRQVGRMQDTLLARAQTARDLVRVQYEKGAASLLDLLDAQRTYTATRLEYAQDLTSYWTAVAALEQATATPLRP